MLLEELGGWKEDTFCLGFPSISPNVHFKAKACKVFEDKIHAFGEAVLCIQEKGAIVHIEALKYFIRTEERLQSWPFQIWSSAAVMTVTTLIESLIKRIQEKKTRLVPCYPTVALQLPAESPAPPSQS